MFKVDNELDWSQYNPSLLKTPKTPALQQQKHPITPGVSRRRPSLKSAESDGIQLTRIAALEIAMQEATEQHEIQMRILRLQELQAVEKLKREKMETEILRHQVYPTAIYPSLYAIGVTFPYQFC